MGDYTFTDATSGDKVNVYYTFGYKRNDDGKVRICATPPSSLPLIYPDHAPPHSHDLPIISPPFSHHLPIISPSSPLGQVRIYLHHSSVPYSP